MIDQFDSPYEGATPEELNNANVQQLLHLHNYLRNELQMIRRFIDQLTDERVERTAESYQRLIHSLISAGSQYAQHLHAHHHGETYLFFPVLKKEGLPAEIVDRLNREHDELGELIDKVSRVLFQVKGSELPQVKDDLRQLGDALHAHLAYEETHVCPLLARWSSPSEFYAALFISSR